MRSLTLPSFWEAYEALPDEVKQAARKSFRRWRESSFHPSLHFKCINQQERIWSARITLGYRALGILEGDTVTWFWIGSHQEYDQKGSSLWLVESRLHVIELRLESLVRRDTDPNQPTGNSMRSGRAMRQG